MNIALFCGTCSMASHGHSCVLHVPTYVECTDSCPNYQLLLVAYIVCCCLRSTDIRLQTRYTPATQVTESPKYLTNEACCILD